MNHHSSINRVYRLIWSAVRNVWIPVSEKTRGRGKRCRRAVGVAALAVGATVAQAGGPTGGQVTAGAGRISRTGATTTITQTTPQLSLSWASFNIAPQETVNFVQPAADSVAVNRIFDTNGTRILGHLNANGQIFLINANGIVFGAGAEVNVGGLVASTLNLGDESAGTNARHFSGSSEASVINEGSINAASGGYVALVGNHVSNQGVISARLGSVVLAAGSAATITFSNNSLVRLQVDQSVWRSIAENGGVIRADGGQVVITAGAQTALTASVVNNTGVIEARTVESHDGSITLLGGMSAGTVNVGGTLDASAPEQGHGGFIETSAEHVQVGTSAKVTTAAAAGLNGSWLIDPTDFTVAASGGNMTGAVLGSSLAGGNVTILSTAGTAQGTGNINVNDVVTWSAHVLTLNAQNNININSAMNASGTASLALKYGQDAVAAGNTSDYFVHAPVSLPAGPIFSTRLGNDGAVVGYTVITSLGAADSTTATDLQGISADLAANYALGGNIDATATAQWNGGAGFSPLGSMGTPYSGNFDGLGHTISNLAINTPLAGRVGLFGTSTGALRNVGLTSVSIVGNDNVGALSAVAYGVISNDYATGHVSGAFAVGGLIGQAISAGVNDSDSFAGVVTGGVYVGGLFGLLDQGSIDNSHTTATVSGTSQVGGLVGDSDGTISNSSATGASVTNPGTHTGGLVGLNGRGTVTNSFATSAVNGGFISGGLIGGSYGAVSNSYATGAVSGDTDVGGLTGTNSSGSVVASYATGSVVGIGSVGGLIGTNSVGVTDSYATGAVSGSSNVGGLIGTNYGSVSRTYATGSVTGSGGPVGGLMGVNQGVTTASFWDVHASASGIGGGDSSGATGLTTAALMALANFTAAAWDISGTGGSGAVWRIYEGNTAPLLTNFLTPLTITAADVSKVYDGAAVTHLTNATFSVAGAGSSVHLINNANPYNGAVNVGSYGATLYSDQQGYDISFAGSTLTVTPATLTVSANISSRVYGQSNPVLTGSITGFAGTDTLANATTGSESFTTTATNVSNVGTYAVSGSGLAANNGNYTFAFAAQNATALSITPATLTYTATPASLTAEELPTGLTGTLSGFVLADNQANATVGTLLWTTSANAASQAGVFAIEGSGLTAANYLFVQAPENASALALRTAIPPVSPPVTPPLSDPYSALRALARNAVGTMEANLPSSQTDVEIALLDPSRDIVMMRDAAGEEQATSAPAVDRGTRLNKKVTLGAAAPTLRIILGGVKLPDNAVNVNLR